MQSKIFIAARKNKRATETESGENDIRTDTYKDKRAKLQSKQNERKSLEKDDDKEEEYRDGGDEQDAIPNENDYKY